jgi:hypothetical protein
MLVRSPNRRKLWLAFFLFLAVQVGFSSATLNLRPGIETMPPAPTDRALKAMALGDDEFLFRYLSRWLEYVGDGGGRVKPLREYDYSEVVRWLEALDDLDQGRSELAHELAARYFGEITNAVDKDHHRLLAIVAYLRAVALKDPKREWRWLVWSANQAINPIADPALMKSVAHDLESPELRDSTVPAWVRVLPIRLYRKAGDEAAAKAAIDRVTPDDWAELVRDREKLVNAINRLEQKPNSQPPSAADK